MSDLVQAAVLETVARILNPDYEAEQLRRERAERWLRRGGIFKVPFLKERMKRFEEFIRDAA